MKQQLVAQIIEALAVGDSFAKSTEFASRSQILSAFNQVDRLLLPEESIAHKDMLYAQVTDDTEQNIFLLEDYIRSNEVSAEVTAQSLLRWLEQTPDSFKYIGPSSTAALNSIKGGVSIKEAGKKGTSCGGVMRAPAAFLVSTSLEEVKRNVEATLLPTHNTTIALEAAMGYGYALFAMTETKDLERITEATIKGCLSVRFADQNQIDYYSLPSCSHRITYLRKELPHFKSSKELLDFLFYVYGTTISSCDVFVAAYAIFLWCKTDVYAAIKLATMVGGDTDTISALAAVLCCVYAEGHNIPESIVKEVIEANNLNCNGLAKSVIEFRLNKSGQS